MILFCLAFIICTIDATAACAYNFWRLTVKTLSSSGWETYIYEIELYSNDTIINDISDISSNIAVANIDYMFDSNSVSSTRFPKNGFPMQGDYIQWKCLAGCAIDSIIVRQSAGSNNIPQWNVQYSDCGQNFTTKWVATTTSAVSTSDAPTVTSTDQCFYNASNCTDSGFDDDNANASATTTTSLLVVIVVLLCLILMVIVGGGIFYYVRKSNSADKQSAKVSPNSYDNAKVAPFVPSPPQSQQHYHAFLSHDWGENSANHFRVRKVCQALKALGMSVWFDEEQIHGHIRDKIVAGIDSCDCMVVFVTRNYINKVNGNEGRDCCKMEFNYGFDHLGPQRMVAVVMEPDLLDCKKWPGSLGAALGSQLYMNMATCDLDDEEVLVSKTKELQKYISGVITTLV